MDIAEIRERVTVGWNSFRSIVETLCLWLIAVGVLALVTHSWILLSNGNERGAIGALLCVVLGAAGAIVWTEQWAAAAHAVLFLIGAAWGRADRAQMAKGAAFQAALGGFWWGLLTYGGPVAVGFGIPAPGLETKMMWAAFWIMLVHHALRIPGRLRIAWLAASTTRAPDAPGVITLPS